MGKSDEKRGIINIKPGRDANLTGDIFTGDKTVNYGSTPSDLAAAFKTLQAEIAASTSADQQAMAEAQAGELQQEISKGEEANDQRVADLVKGVLELAPDAVETLASILGFPLVGKALGPITRGVMKSLGL